MGIPGWNRLLAGEGWLPDTSAKAASSSQKACCSTSLWMTDLSMSCMTNNNNNSRFSERIVAIPSGSELHVDGYCLCFHIYTVAYARHMNSVLHHKNNHQQRPCVRYNNSNNKSNKLSQQQVRHLLPNFLPLKLLAEVTTEFVQTLRHKHQMKLFVYWDGEQRYSFKQTTDTKRQSSLDDEWSDLQQYCLYGRMPATASTLCEWVTLLPKHRLFATQVLHALQVTRNVSMVFCDEEADHVLARAVQHEPHKYIVGFDSDFCFFPDVNYIPLSTLDASSQLQGVGAVTACVIRRDALAQSLHLPDEEAMVELAILMGNDYITDPASAEFINCPVVVGVGVVGVGVGVDGSGNNNNNNNRRNYNRRNDRTEAILSFLRDQGAGYRVTSSSKEIQEVLRFVRMLYNLEVLTEFSFQGDSDDDDDDASDNDNDDDGSEAMVLHTNGEVVVADHPTASVRPLIHDDELDLTLAAIQPLKDRSVKEAVLRCLAAYLDRAPVDNHRTVMTQEHLAVFEQLAINERQSYKDVDNEIADKAWRPLWQDVAAVYLIEKIINKCIWGSPASPVVRLNPPYTIFDQYKYHALLRTVRDKASLSTLKNDAALLSPQVITVYEPEPEVVERPVLPVDEFEDIILESVRKHRVTIIQGDTGCGKSSRIPIMLLRAPPPDPSSTGKSKLFISQPRRIAAKALVERLRAVEPDLRDQIALRMGHGVREYETKSTRAFFVTTGYLVRVLANSPERFNDVTYLIIDEVHERSVDTDILCLLCRRLLTTNPRIRLVLMSATLAAALYQEYFQVTEPVIKVGARRFPVEEVYLSDLSSRVTLPGKEVKNVKALSKECLEMRCSRPPSMSYMEKLYSVVAYLATVVGKPGSSVLIFVPGMNDIVAITELVEQLYVTGITFTCFPIHSDIPFEDQMLAFDAPNPDEVKIIIATNAAESSVTLPDVDHVICLGLCKQIVYNELSHRQMLLPTWISRASGTQRAGRTGRLRPGTVYRMYERENYDIHMEAFEPGEMLRIPLDSVILMLKEMLSDEEVTQVLLSCLEPPNISTIDRSFQSLFRSHFITSPNDSCEITTLGLFVSALGIDLALGSLIGLGIQFGVGAEAIQMAGILAFPKSPWIQSNPLIHEPANYNDKVATTFASKCHFDANLFSEPLAAMNLLWEYGRVNTNAKQKWCHFYGIFAPRLKRLESTCLNLSRRVADFLGISGDLIQVTTPPILMPHAMVTVLRVIQVWVFNESVIQFDPGMISIGKSKEGLSLDLLGKSDRIERGHLEQVLHTERHPFVLKGHSEMRQTGTFDYKIEGERERHDSCFVAGFEHRLLSYSTEKGCGLAWVSFSDCMTVYVREEFASAPDFIEALPTLFNDCRDRSLLVAKLPSGKARRGRAERPCGMWTIHKGHFDAPRGDKADTLWIRFSFVKSKAAKKTLEKLQRDLDSYARGSSLESLSFQFPWNAELDIEKKSLGFLIVVRGPKKGVADVDLRDLFASPRVQSSTKKSFDQQKVIFPFTSNVPLTFKGHATLATTDETTSWGRPVVKCIPEAARMLSVLASGRRREHVVRLSSMEDTTDDNLEECALLDLHLDPKQTNIAHRWKRFNTDLSVYVETNSVPASAVPMFGSDMMYCSCANTLELRGGGIRAEGLTLLPPGKLFLLLCRLTFGLFKQENVDDGSIIQKSILWVDPKCQEISRKLLSERITKAIRFNASTVELGEKLECFPEKVAELVSVFNGVDGYKATRWDSLASNPFIGGILKISQREQKVTKVRSYVSREPDGPSLGEDDVAIDREEELILAATSHLDAERKDSNGRNGSNVSTRAKPTRQKASAQPDILRKSPMGNREAAEGHVFTKLTSFSAADIQSSERLFARTLPSGQELNISELPSSNILSLVVLQFRTETGSAKSGDDMRLEGSDWEVYTISLEGRIWYFATYSSSGVAFVRRTSKNLSAWLKCTDASKARPSTIAAAVSCIPPGSFTVDEKAKLVVTDGGKRNALAFESLELAVRMEAAFWLERQFMTGKRHWYQHLDLANMVGRLKTEYEAEKKRKKKSNKSSDGER